MEQHTNFVMKPNSSSNNYRLLQMMFG
jgi:hypothetical protein